MKKKLLIKFLIIIIFVGFFFFIKLHINLQLNIMQVEEVFSY